MSKVPFVVRWRNGVMDDPNPILSWRALVAAVALTRYADASTGRNCYPGAGQCARNMRVSERTIRTGWAELVEAGWIEIMPLPASRRRSQGALKVLRWPDSLHHVQAVDPTTCTSDLEPMHVVPPTIPGNQGAVPAPAEVGPTCAWCGDPLPDADSPEGTICLPCYRGER